MNASINHLVNLFFDQLRDIHSMESQVADTLPHLGSLATYPALREHFLSQEPLAREQKELVERVFDTHTREVGSDVCLAMKGLVAGGNEHLAMAKDPCTRDFLLVAHGMRIQHYAIAAYQFAAALALHLDFVPERDVLSNQLAAGDRSARELEAIAAELFASSPQTRQ